MNKPTHDPVHIKSLQETILDDAIQSKNTVTIFLMNGFPIKCTVTGYDTNVVDVVTDGKRKMIYKHYISTIVYG